MEQVSQLFKLPKVKAPPPSQALHSITRIGQNLCRYIGIPLDVVFGGKENICQGVFIGTRFALWVRVRFCHANPMIVMVNKLIY